MTTPEEKYVETLHKLVDAMRKWGDLHPDQLVDISFPDDAVVIGEIGLIPQEFLGNDAAREMVVYLAAEVPEGTIEQLRTICAGISAAEANGEKN